MAAQSERRIRLVNLSEKLSSTLFEVLARKDSVFSWTLKVEFDGQGASNSLFISRCLIGPF